jgi:hypothetical protein
MANDLTARPWYVDTASSTPLWKSPLMVKFIEVVGGASATVGGTMAVVNDQNGKNIVTANFQTANAGEIQTYNVENWFNGLVVPTLGTGVTLRVHVR